MSRAYGSQIESQAVCNESINIASDVKVETFSRMHGLSLAFFAVMVLRLRNGAHRTYEL